MGPKRYLKIAHSTIPKLWCLRKFQPKFTKIDKNGIFLLFLGLKSTFRSISNRKGFLVRGRLENPRVGNESFHRGKKKSCVTFLNKAPTIEISHPEVDQNRQKRHFKLLFTKKITFSAIKNRWVGEIFPNLPKILEILFKNDSVYFWHDFGSISTEKKKFPFVQSGTKSASSHRPEIHKNSKKCGKVPLPTDLKSAKNPKKVQKWHPAPMIHFVIHFVILFFLSILSHFISFPLINFPI